MRVKMIYECYHDIDTFINNFTVLYNLYTLSGLAWSLFSIRRQWFNNFTALICILNSYIYKKLKKLKN